MGHYGRQGNILPHETVCPYTTLYISNMQSVMIKISIYNVLEKIYQKV